MRERQAPAPVQKARRDPACNAIPACDASRLKPLRWLFLQSKEDELNRMEPFYRVLISGAQASTSAVMGDARHWGPGRAYWKSAKSYAENVEHRYGLSDYFDVVMTCGDVERYLDPLSASRATITARRHECREQENCQRVLNRGRFDIAALVNPFEIATNEDIRASSHKMAIIHLPSP